MTHSQDLPSDPSNLPASPSPKIEAITNTTQLQLADLQGQVISGVKEGQKANEKPDEMLNFFIEGISSFFGDNPKVKVFLEDMARWFMSWSEEAPSEEALFGQIEKGGAPEKNIEGGIIAHQAMGWGTEHPNSLEALESALKGGEGELEIDVRLDSYGALVLSHDPLQPGQKATSLTEVLSLLKKYPDATLVVDVKGGPETARMILEAIKNDQIQGQVAFASFDPQVLKEIHAELPDAPLFFHYYPTSGMTFIKQYLDPWIQKGALSQNTIQKILSMADKMGDTNTAMLLEESSLYYNGKSLNPKPLANAQQVHVYELLPPDEILTLIKNSHGCLSVPWNLVQHCPSFFSETKSKGIKVAIHGIKNKEEARKAIAMGGNIVITDAPNLIS